MNEKIQSALKSDLALAVRDGVKTAAINMAAALVLSAVVKGVVKLVEVAADAVTENAEKV